LINSDAALDRGIKQGEQDMQRTAQGFQTRAAARLEALQTAYQNAKTPDERNEIAQQIRGLQGKDANADAKASDRYLKVKAAETTNIDGSKSGGEEYWINPLDGRRVGGFGPQANAG
jgi:hypothetical protein